MNKIITLIKTSLVIAVLTIAVTASTVSEKEYIASFVGRENIPIPVRVETPYIAVGHVGETIKVSFVVDADGKVENVKLKNSLDVDTETEIVKAIAKWEFKPLIKDGTAVKTNVELPIKITSLEYISK